MALISCDDCGNDVSKNATECPNCGAPIRQSARYADKNFDRIENELNSKEKITIETDKIKPYKWLAMTNAAILLTIIVLSGGKTDFGAILIIIGLGAAVPFAMLYLSKWLAIKSHKIKLLTENNLINDAEKQLIKIVTRLSTCAGLNVIPEIGIYESDEMNAFATGKNREDSLIAFSSQLLCQMDEDAIAAVAAHELAHIANGDMVTMTMVQAAVNAVVLLVTLPVMALKVFAFFSEDFGWVEFIVVSVVKFIVVTVMLFLGNLIVKAFSRKREFEADKLAATILDPKRMIHALNALNSQEEIPTPKGQLSYASLKISSPPAIMDILSTHPSIERRIEALEEFSS